MLDDRARAINWWLAVVGLVLTFFAIAVPILGLLGYRRFKEIEKEAQESAEEAKRFVEEIEQIRDKSNEYYQDMTAEKAVDDPAAEEKAEAVSKDPQASLKDKLIASAIALQKEGKKNEAIKRWRSIASATEGIDNDLAADAWFSIGYLEAKKGDKASLEKGILAYDRVIDLNRNLALAYNNRGFAKFKLGQYDDAIADCTHAIDLNSNLAGAYNNRGIAKAKQGHIAEARTDFERALDIARKTGDKKALASAEKNLRKLENIGKA